MGVKAQATKQKPRALVSWRAHAFVQIVFGALSVSFVFPTLVLWLEFEGLDRWTLLMAHSHLFVFFPLFGLAALAAFYQPSVMLTDYYWTRGVRFGRTRFIIGFAIVAAAAAWATAELSSRNPRGIWEVAPTALKSDLSKAGPRVIQMSRAEPSLDVCREPRTANTGRQPIFTTLQCVRAEGESGRVLLDLLRACKPSPLVEPAKETGRRHCFAASAMLSTDECCAIQKQLTDQVGRLVADPATRSQLSHVEMLATFPKAFFIIVIVVIGALLALWQRRLRRIYRVYLGHVERGLVAGAVIMLVWLLMDYGYQQTSDLVFGRESSAFPIRLSLILAPWAVLLVLYFSRAPQTSVPQITPSQLLTVVASNIATLQYDTIANLAFRFLGAGADYRATIGLAIAGLFLLGFALATCRLPAVIRRLRGRNRHEPRQPAPTKSDRPMT